MWRRQRTWIIVLAVLGMGMSILTLYQQNFRFDYNAGVWLAYIPAALLFSGLLFYYRWRSHVQVLETGLKVSNLLSSIVIGYDLIRATRVQPLERHFQEARKRLIRPINRPLMPRDALFVRLRGDDEYTAQVRKKLGRQLVSDDGWLALPVPDPLALAGEINARLPDRANVNLGGKRRRRRGR